MPISRRKDPVTYISLDRAIEKHHISRDRLEQAIENDEIETARLADDDSTLLVTESLRAWLADRRVDRDQFAHLEDQPISIHEARKKYGFSWTTINRWIEAGHVKLIGLAPGYKRRRLINEADIAYARALADAKKPLHGQSIFP